MEGELSTVPRWCSFTSGELKSSCPNTCVCVPATKKFTCLDSIGVIKLGPHPKYRKTEASS